VECFEGGVFGLDGVDFGDWGGVSGFRLRVPGLCHGDDCGKGDVLEFAFRRVSAEHSERPTYFVFPARRIESRAGIDWERGVSCYSLLVDR
jgi:hypothetical protein